MLKNILTLNCYKKNSFNLGHEVLRQLSVWLSILSLFFTVTNLIPISALSAILVITLPFTLFQYQSHHPVFISSTLLITYFIIQVLSYHPASFLDLEFYRRDGNVFITFIPLLTLSLLKIKNNIERLSKIFIIFAGVLNIFFTIIYFFTGGTIWLFEEGIYHFLFEAHNAAGGFIAVLTALTLASYLETKKRTYLFLLLTNLVGLILSFSRGSILGIIIGFGIASVKTKSHLRIIVISLLLFQVGMVTWFYKNAPPNFLNFNLFSVEGYDLNDIDPRGGGNIINRGFYLWPKATHLFLQSPVLGVGFGSFNDLPYNLQGISHIYVTNVPSSIVFSSAHAHHSFLHILAETGFIGFLLLVYFLLTLRRFILTITSPSVRNGLHIAYWVNIISSLTEHRLFTPSQMLPFTIIVGLAIASARFAGNNNFTSLVYQSKNNSTSTFGQTVSFPFKQTDQK